MIRKIIGLVLGLLLIWILGSYIISGLFSSNYTQDWGQKLIFKGMELYYTPAITFDEANRVGWYLVEEWGQALDGSRKTVQLNKTAPTYEFRMVTKPGLENDQVFLRDASLAARELSDKIFGGSPVEVHLCDPYLRTILIVPMSKMSMAERRAQADARIQEKVLKEFNDSVQPALDEFRNKFTLK